MGIRRAISGTPPSFNPVREVKYSGSDGEFFAPEKFMRRDDDRRFLARGDPKKRRLFTGKLSMLRSPTPTGYLLSKLRRRTLQLN
jgi:hypothetical protein